MTYIDADLADKEYDIDPIIGYAKDEEFGFFVSWDYDMFSFDRENRDVDPAHLKRVKTVIANKYLIDPIKVTKDFVILDGQHRFEACKELRKPIRFHFAIRETIDDMVSQNQVNKRWTLTDFIYKHYKAGNTEYNKLVRLLEKYSLNKSKDYGRGHTKKYAIGINTILVIASGQKKVATGGGSSSTTKAVKDGRFVFRHSFEDAVKEIDCLLSWRKLIKLQDQRSLDRVLLFVYRCPEINEVRLKEKFMKFRESGNTINVRSKDTVIYDLLDELQKIYNLSLRLNKQNFHELYKKYLEE